MRALGRLVLVAFCGMLSILPCRSGGQPANLWRFITSIDLLAYDAVHHCHDLHAVPGCVPGVHRGTQFRLPCYSQRPAAKSQPCHPFQKHCTERKHEERRRETRIKKRKALAGKHSTFSHSGKAHATGLKRIEFALGPGRKSARSDWNVY